MPKQKVKLSQIVLAVFWILSFVGCSSTTDELVQRSMSPDKQYWAEIWVNRGSALKPDWYAVSVRKVHPSLTEILPRQRNETLCSLQGAGKISAKWEAQDRLLVTCSGCKRTDFSIFKEGWNGVQAKYAFE